MVFALSYHFDCMAAHVLSGYSCDLILRTSCDQFLCTSAHYLATYVCICITISYLVATWLRYIYSSNVLRHLINAAFTTASQICTLKI